MRPQTTDYPAFYETYISKVIGENIKDILLNSLNDIEDFLLRLDEDKADYAYAPEKWTVKQVLQHCIDSERVFAYRAMCFARGERQSLPRFEQNGYVENVDVNNKPLSYLKQEMLLVRRCTIALFQHLGDADLAKPGLVGNNAVTVLSWGYIIAGHWLHHQGILATKYIS